MDVWARIMVLFVIQINIIGASDVDPYSSPVPRVGFSTGVFFKYPSGTFTRHNAYKCVVIPEIVVFQCSRSVQPDDKISQIRQRFMPRL